MSYRSGSLDGAGMRWRFVLAAMVLRSTAREVPLLAVGLVLVGVGLGAGASGLWG